MTQEEKEAQEKLKELAMYYARPQLDQAKTDIKQEASRGISSLGMNPDDVATAVAAAKAASDLSQGKLKLKGNITDNLSGEVSMSPREKAIRLMYNKSF